MNLIGKTIANRYDLIEKTGIGGMATVYVAKDLMLNRYVAVKVLKEEYTTDEEFVKRFNTEAQSAASLTHQNIVSIYDVGNEDNIYYIVMELVRGKTLKQIITEEGKLPWKWSVNIATQIASALEIAHRHNIVHRDIKPHNIIITEDGTAKVTDFGIAKAVSNATITAFGTTVGSVHYFSPEQAKGGYTDAKSDIYSLGVVMYEMLTGKVPFDADTSVSVALKHMQEEPVPPMEVNENIPNAVNDIILKAMQKEPMARYQTISEMIADLKQSLKDPDGDFVKEDDLNDGRTRRMAAVTGDMLHNEQKEENRTQRNKKKQNKNSSNTKIKILVIAAAIVVLFLIVFGITSLGMNLFREKEVALVNVVNMTEDEAKKALEDANLKYNKLNEVYNSKVEAGKIISQEPDGNKKVKAKSTVNVIVSKGTETTKVPKVIGAKYDEAVKILETAKLSTEKIEEASKTVEKGIVISQETDPDAIANAGDTVKIHVSTGYPQVTMPKVIDLNEEEARKKLTDLKLKPIVKYSEDSSKGNGVVVSQSINEGTYINEDSEVTITINKFNEIKSISATINLSKIYTKQSETETTCKLKVTVDGDLVLNNEAASISSTSIPVTISGKGTVTVKIYVNDILKVTKDINLNTTNSYTFE